MLEIIFSDYRPFAQDALAFTLFAIALVWGGGPERVIALTWIVLFEALITLGRAFQPSGYSLDQINPLLALSDVAALFIFVVCALYANRNYVLWIAAMQVLAVNSHAAHGMVETISPIAYLTMAIAPGWLQLLFLAVGLSRHILRRRKFGPYRDWRVSRRWQSPNEKAWLKGRFLRILGHDFFPIKENQ